MFLSLPHWRFVHKFWVLKQVLAAITTFGRTTPAHHLAGMESNVGPSELLMLDEVKIFDFILPNRTTPFENIDNGRWVCVDKHSSLKFELIFHRHQEYDPRRLVSCLHKIDLLTIYQEGRAMGVNMAGYKKVSLPGLLHLQRKQQEESSAHEVLIYPVASPLHRYRRQTVSGVLHNEA